MFYFGALMKKILVVLCVLILSMPAFSYVRGQWGGGYVHGHPDENRYQNYEPIIPHVYHYHGWQPGPARYQYVPGWRNYRHDHRFHAIKCSTVRQCYSVHGHQHCSPKRYCHRVWW
jgi:hypothetical protein